ncbi:glycoside hydrolase family 18 protein [Bacillus marasmi]|uniref:glycoside hydrolase family 18 protein n=1 Tax=Bacillus marasmi TaxID=1926279 RepID=UPI0011CB4F87|nr:glycoside hydrolase family 18 protein [Bacillus marasmi]
MKLRILLIVLFTFIGGFFVGGLVKEKQTKPLEFKITTSEPSQKMLKHKQAPNWKENKEKVLIGYVQDFRNPANIDYRSFTHLIFSFAHPNKDGSLVLNGDQALKNLRTMVTNAKKTDTKVLLAIGGWFHIQGGESYPFFQSAINDDVARAKLVDELSNIVKRERLDGVDVDFEHPRSAKDSENLSKFIKQLSDKLHSEDKQLTIAVHAKIHAGALTEAHFIQYDPAMFQYVDYVNIMAYDGQWDGGYNAANLSPYPFTEKIVNYWSALFQSLELSREKLVLGVPSYAQPEDPAVKQLSYQSILEHDPTNANRDSTTVNGTTYYYNGDETIQRKTNLALQHGFGGMMLWEVGLDATGSSSLTSVLFEILGNI